MFGVNTFVFCTQCLSNIVIKGEICSAKCYINFKLTIVHNLNLTATYRSITVVGDFNYLFTSSILKIVVTGFN